MTPHPFFRARLRPFSILAAVSAALLVAADARAQRLGLEGDHFTVDGASTFLTMVTSFGGMGAPNVVADLHLMKTLGFDGFRIWPMLNTGPGILNQDGSIRQAEFSHFLSILDQARIERLIVDLTFTHEHAGMTPAQALVGMTNV